MFQKEWDLYFLRIAKEVSTNSKCLSRKIGTVLVKDNSIISTGYNGPAVGIRHCNERDLNFYLELDQNYQKLIGLENKTEKIKDTCPRKVLGYMSGQGLHLCQAGHAERNALIQAARNGISTLGTTLYCWCPQVCKECAIEIINSGVERLVFLEGPIYDSYSGIILEESCIEIEKIKEELI